MKKEPSEPKWHHYVPVTYLKHFCDSTGTLMVHRKAANFAARRLRPKDIAAAHDFYSWPRDDGTIDRASFERIFDRFAEVDWNGLVNKFQRQETLDDADLEPVATFICLQHARVPAVRDAIESRLSASVMEELRRLHMNGNLPPLPAELRSIDDLVAPIDPSTSLEALEHSMDAAQRAMNRVTFRVVHNRADEEFLTSDNPVIWFDPSRVRTPSFSPYVLSPDGPTTFLVTISPTICLVGRSGDQGFGWDAVEATDNSTVSFINEMVAAFAHEWVFSRNHDATCYVDRHRHISPVMEHKRFQLPDGTEHFRWQWAFGARSKKPKWQRPKPF